MAKEGYFNKADWAQYPQGAKYREINHDYAQPQKTLTVQGFGNRIEWGISATVVLTKLSRIFKRRWRGIRILIGLIKILES